MEYKLKIFKYPQEGDLQHTYSPLQNLQNVDGSVSGFNIDNKQLKIDLEHPINIECQPSYDGTVNLILNDDKNPPRIVNSRFSKIEDNKFKIINRNQLEQTNLYSEQELDRQSRLFKSSATIPIIDLQDIYNTGQLKGGTYTFYLRLADGDTNKTDIVAESGQVIIFKGNIEKLSTVSGTLANEKTDKSVSLKIKNLDTTFSKMYIYYNREFSDTNGVRMSEYAMIKKPYDITSDTNIININGYEEIETLTINDLNINYLTVDAAKTQAQVQNMLFFGNVQQSIVNIKELQNISYFINVSLKQSENSIGWVNPDGYVSDTDLNTEYYNPINNYYYLGYWPDEIYRLGIVYIFNDDTLSPVFNLRGCSFENFDDSNLLETDKLINDNNSVNYIEKSEFIINRKTLCNTRGVFRIPNVSPYKNENGTVGVYPIYFKIEINEDCKNALTKQNIKGFFIVRQKRIPTILAQGLSVAVDSFSYIPMIRHGERYITEGFLNSDKVLTHQFEGHVKENGIKACSGLLCLDANVNPYIKSAVNNTEFKLQKFSSGSEYTQNKRHYIYKNLLEEYQRLYVTSNLIYVDSDVSLRYANGYNYSTKCGIAEDVSKFSFFGSKDRSEHNTNLLRGIYCPFIGTSSSLEDNAIYNIKISGFSESKMKEYFSIRGNDNSPFYAISNRYLLTYKNPIDVYRGDCYTNTVTIRMNRNFTDPDIPISEEIISRNTWKDNYTGFDTTAVANEEGKSYSNMNRADINTVNLGMWVSYKCLSSCNLGLRSIDPFHTDEIALMGNKRSFYPVQDMSAGTANKIEESWLLSDGYNETLSKKAFFSYADVPYVQQLFDNRVMFSNIQASGDFKNAYRIFQGLSYKDIERQYGAIVKFIPYNNNIFCVFEHGLGVIPINEKALISTQSGQSIHMYGAGVLQNQISLISPDFGSIWADSVIRTPVGIYGVDTYAKKIWCYNNNGLSIISDMKVQKFLNDNIKLSESDKKPIISLKNVKTHYNNYKGDVMFTFYNDDEKCKWNICYNERMGKWITRYTWTPLFSENINNVFYTLDQKRGEYISKYYKEISKSYGLKAWIGSEEKQYIENSGETSIIIKNAKTNEIINDIESCEAVFIYRDDETVDGYVNIDKANGQITLKGISEEDENGIPEGAIAVTLSIEREGFTNSFKVYIPITYNTTDYKNGFYKHGKAGIFDEKQTFKPANWYDKQETFEFEFIVNDTVGMHKIFNNLVIISNKAQPDEITYEIEGDVNTFKETLNERPELAKNFEFKNDSEIGITTFVVKQECKDMAKEGRRLGNIQYKEDSWYSTIEPLRYNDPNDREGVVVKEMRVRDKYVKIRVKYSGEDYAIITALKTLYTISYA